MIFVQMDLSSHISMARKIFSELSNDPDFSIEEVTSLLKRKPEILEINKESEINSGYKKSLKEDKSIG